MNGPRALPPGARSGWQAGADAVGAVIGAVFGVGWVAAVGLVRWCREHPRTTTVGGSVLAGFLLGGYLGALCVVAGFLLGLWWVLVNAPEAVAKAFSGHPSPNELPPGGGSGQVLGPARLCPACGLTHAGDVWLVGPDPQGRVVCIELEPNRRRYQ